MAVKRFQEKSIEGSRAKFTWGIKGGAALAALLPDFRFVEDESTKGTRIGVAKGETELMEEVNRIIGEVREEGLYDQWYEEYTEYARSLGIQ